MRDNPTQPIFNVIQASQPTPLEQLASLRETQQALGMQGIEEQRQGIADTKAQIEQLRANQPDPRQQQITRALLAAGDMLGGTGGEASRLYQMFQPPDTTRDQTRLQQILAQQQNNLSRAELGILDQQITSQYRDAQLDLQKQIADRKMKELEQTRRSRGIDLTPGEKEVDKKFAKDYASWTTGGFSNVQGNLEKLDGALARINESDEVGSTILPEMIRARTNPDSVTVEQDVGNVVFQSLKEILGGQFTEKEGQKLVQQSYDPRLSDKENAKKVKDSLTKLRNMAKAKQEAVDYYSANGTLRGFKGNQSMTLDKFNKDLKNKYLGEEGGKSGPESRYQQLKQKYGY